MKLIFATHNDNKLKELKEILKDTNLEIVSLKELNDYEDIIEDGNTFEENSIIKAVHIARKYNVNAIADDSGIEISYLNNEPGIYSARYSGKGDYENNLKVLNLLENIENRSARFVCVISTATPSGEVKTYEGIVEGKIANEPRGNNLFGYDPIFIPNGYNETFGELDNEIKSKISHRANALNKLLKDLSIKKPV